jgi:hypothetical protein
MLPNQVRVERVQMTRIVGGLDWAEREAADPIWRVLICKDGDERCFDFETEAEANNLKLAIEALALPAAADREAIREALKQAYEFAYLYSSADALATCTRITAALALLEG